jgi:glycosyltransferase involved in cell wall biosynthesis
MTKRINDISVLRVSTVAFFIDTQLHSQIQYIRNSEMSVTVIASDFALKRPIKGVNYFSIKITRNINVLKDIVALFFLLKIFKEKKFDIVHTTTPKAGFLCSIAGIIARVPIRLHTFTGQPWVTLGHPKKFMAMGADKLIGILNTHCYADSHSQREFLIKKKIIDHDEISVLGEGSISGFDTDKFNRLNFNDITVNSFKNELNIPLNFTIFLFVGRVVIDKGVLDLIKAFEEIAFNIDDIFLLIVGPREPGSKRIDSEHERVLFCEYTNNPEEYMSISNILCIPSYREGFGTVVIEAAAMGLPAIGTDIYGLTDSIVDNQTGLLVKPGDVNELKLAMVNLYSNKDYRIKMGLLAQKRANLNFTDKKINQLLVEDYISKVKSL